MGRLLLTGAAGAILSLLAGTIATAADPQLVASAGLTQEEARGMTLDEIAAHKFNRDRQNEQIVVERATIYSAFAPSRTNDGAIVNSLDVYYLQMHNGTSDGDDRQGIASRSPVFNPATRQQLAASAGLDAGSAAEMSLGEIAVRKFNHESDGDNRIGSRY